MRAADPESKQSAVELNFKTRPFKVTPAPPILDEAVLAEDSNARRGRPG